MVPQLTHITDYLVRNARDYPSKLALVTDDRSLTWQELWTAVEPASRALRGRLPADEQALVGLLMPNSWQYVVAYLSIVHAGHIAVPIDVIYKQLEIDAIVRQMQPKLVLVDEANRSRIGDDRPVLTLAELNQAEPAGKPLRLPADQQIATIFFTSGTTGKPKAVPNTHANHLWNIKVCSAVWQWTQEDSLLISVRLPHMLGSVMGLSGVLYHGNTFYLQDRFDAEKALQLLSEGNVTMFSHGPLAFAKMLEVVNRYDTSAVRLFISGSGPLSPATWQKFKQQFGAEILEVYGSSETGRIASNLLDERIAGSPGRPLPEVQLKLDESSELLVKSPGLFPGYFHNDALTNERLTKDGYWRTGDIAELIDGRIILKGRAYEIIRRRGYTVSPRDIEWALLQNSDIKEVAVLGDTDPAKLDDRLIYFLSSSADEATITDYCRVNLPSIWRPDKIIKLDTLPRTNSGKVNLPVLRAMIN